MSTDISSLLNALMASGGKEAIAGKQDSLQKLADSAEGKKVGAMLEGSGDFQRAVERGDTAAMKKCVSSLLATDEGAELARKLAKIMK